MRQIEKLVGARGIPDENLRISYTLLLPDLHIDLLEQKRIVRTELIQCDAIVVRMSGRKE